MTLYKKTFKILLPPTIVFLFHVLMIVVFRIYTIFPAFDIPMHLIGGLSIGISAIIWINFYKSQIQAPKWFLFLWIIGLTLLAVTLWEFAEFAGDYYFHTTMQVSLADTMLDALLGLVGGGIAGIYYVVKK